MDGTVKALLGCVPANHALHVRTQGAKLAYIALLVLVDGNGL
jgi:hypothetical protein